MPLIELGIICTYIYNCIYHGANTWGFVFELYSHTFAGYKFSPDSFIGSTSTYIKLSFVHNKDIINCIVVEWWFRNQFNRIDYSETVTEYMYMKSGRRANDHDLIMNSLWLSFSQCDFNLAAFNIISVFRLQVCNVKFFVRF